MPNSEIDAGFSTAETGPKQPDPTARTIDQLRREIGALRELVEAWEAGNRKEIEAYRIGTERAVKLLQEATDRIPTYVGSEVAKLQELHKEKFDSMQVAIESSYKLLVEMITGVVNVTNAKFQGNQTALDAALKTQKEASDKIEQNFSKQFENLGALINTTLGGLSGQISDMKDRLTTIESRAIGGTDQKKESADNRGVVFSVIGALIGTIGLVGGIVSIILSRGP